MLFGGLRLLPKFAGLRPHKNDIFVGPVFDTGGAKLDRFEEYRESN
jgi:hypothetical protein